VLALTSSLVFIGNIPLKGWPADDRYAWFVTLAGILRVESILLIGRFLRMTMVHIASTREICARTKELSSARPFLLRDKTMEGIKITRHKGCDATARENDTNPTRRIHGKAAIISR
jgi:hypothetical protein